MKYDFSSTGFYTFDCLGWPFTAVPPGGGCTLIDELTLAVSGAAGTAAIAAAKMGLKTLAVGGVGDDLMGKWVLERLESFGVDASGMQTIKGGKTSSSIVTTRADGSRPALHMKGATGDFYVDDRLLEQVTDAKVVLDRETGRSRGFGFVTFSDPSAADAAIRALDGSTLDGRTIRVNEAENKPRDDRGDRRPSRW